MSMPLIFPVFAYGLGLWPLFQWSGKKTYFPWEHRYKDAINARMISSGTTMAEFRANETKYGLYYYMSDPKNKH